jgi:predicted aspartyl protease
VRYSQSYRGRLKIETEYRLGPYRLFIAVPCRIGNEADAVHCLVDTAAEWCVLSQEFAEALGLTEAPRSHRLETRLGTFAGSLERISVHLPGPMEEGLTVDATWFVSNDWPGPNVLGWKGCLERFRFALDSADELFYFASHDDPK